MADRATPNLPARDYRLTIAFYEKLGFDASWHDQNWLILERDGLCLEFFKYHDLNPAESSFSCCLRLDDLSAFYANCIAASIPEAKSGWPRLHPPTMEHSGMAIAYLVDLDGTLLRLVQN